jgi:hypothetical protein
MTTYWSDRLRAAVRLGAAGRFRDAPGASALAQGYVYAVLADQAAADGTVPGEIAVLDERGQRVWTKTTTASIGCAACGMSKRGARRVLDALQAAKLLRVVERSGHAAVFIVIWPDADADAAVDTARSPTAPSSRQASSAGVPAEGAHAPAGLENTVATEDTVSSQGGHAVPRTEDTVSPQGGHADPPLLMDSIRIRSDGFDPDQRNPPSPFPEPEGSGNGLGLDAGHDQAGEDEPPPSSEAPITPPSPQLTLALVEPARRDPVTIVFAAYLAARAARIEGGPQPRLTESRRKLIRARLRDGYSVEDLSAAVTGVFLREFNVTAKHYSLELVLRNGGQVEKYQAVVSDTDANAVRVRDFFGKSWTKRLGAAYAAADSDLAAAARLWSDARRLATERGIAEEAILRHWTAEFFDDPDRRLADARWPLSWLPKRVGTYGLPSAARPAAASPASSPAETTQAPPPVNHDVAAHAAAMLAVVSGSGGPSPTPRSHQESHL